MRPTDVIRKYAENPILTAKDVPFPATLAYNCGACKVGQRYALAFRVDYYKDDGTPDRMKWPRILNIGLAWSDDGFHFKPEARPILEATEEECNQTYDPRLSVIDGRYYLCYAADTPFGIRSGLAVSDDLHRWERIYLSEPDNRNAVIFPERVNGLITRLDRPFARGYTKNRPFDIWMSQSPDGRFWGNHKLVLSAKNNEWSNDKIGPATPPIKTPQGWLALYHGVSVDSNHPGCGWEGWWNKTYSAGVMLLDLHEPWKIIGRCKEPVLIPDKPYELEAGGGLRPNVVFPGGLIAEPDGTCKIYWGAADTVVAVGTAKIQDLVDLCTK